MSSIYSKKNDAYNLKINFGHEFSTKFLLQIIIALKIH